MPFLNHSMYVFVGDSVLLNTSTNYTSLIHSTTFSTSSLTSANTVLDQRFTFLLVSAIVNLNNQLIVLYQAGSDFSRLNAVLTGAQTKMK